MEGEEKEEEAGKSLKSIEGRGLDAPELELDDAAGADSVEFVGLYTGRGLGRAFGVGLGSGVGERTEGVRLTTEDED